MDVDNKYSSLADELKTTDRKVSGIEAHLDSLTSNVETLSGDLREFMRIVSSRLSDVNKTNWSALLPALAMSGAAVAFYATLLSNSLDGKIDRNVAWLKDRQDLIAKYEQKQIDAIQSQVNHFQNKHYENVSEDKDALELKFFDNVR